MNRKELLNKFYVTKEYNSLKKILANGQTSYEKYYLAKIYAQEKDYKTASLIYKSINQYYEYGRCELLQGNFDNAKKIWHDIKEDSGRSLLEFINLYVINVPTFFQIRAFLEVDLDAL